MVVDGMNKRRKITVVLLLVLLVLAVVIWQIPGDNNVIKFGVVGPISGFASYYGEQEMKGVQLAVDEINFEGGINGKLIELIVEDSKANPRESVTAVNKLINFDQVDFIIGDAWASTTAVMIPVTNENEVILVSPDMLLSSGSEDDFFFRTIPNIQDQMKLLASYAYNDLGSRRVGVLQQQNVFGEEHTIYFVKEFEELGGKIVGIEKFPLEQNDLLTELTKLRDKNPDTLFNMHAAPKVALPAEKAEEMGFKVKWITHFGAENSQVVEQNPKVTHGFNYVYSYDSTTGPESVSKFVTSYMKKYGEAPDLIAANSYDAVMVLAKAIEESGVDTTKVKQSLLETQNYHGGSGVLSFDHNGDVKKELFVKRIENGEFVRLS